MTSTPGDYGGYRGIIDEARALEQSDRDRERLICPVCGNKLQVNARGDLNCDVGHYRSGPTG